MDGLCDIGRQEQAVYCCVCKFPLLQFCEEHLREHRTKPGFHFTLPLEAKFTITTMELSIQYRNWLHGMSLSFDLLRERVEQLSLSENEIDAVYGALQQYAYDTAVRLKHEFSVAKTQFREVVESAIKETSDHVLETQSFIPENYFSRLLWSCDSNIIAAQQFYSVQVNFVKENLDAAFQVALRFTVPGLEHLTIGQFLQSPNERIEEMMQALAIKNETHTHELEDLRKALEDATVYCAESAKTQQRQEAAIQDLQRQLQQARAQLQEICNDSAAKESRYSALEKEKSSLAAQVTNLVAQVKVKDGQLTAANNEIAGLGERYSAMVKRVKELEQESRVRPSLAPVPAAQGSLQVWKCANCSYQYNLNSAAKCLQCKMPNHAAPMDTEAVRPVQNGTPNAFWECQTCRYLYNQQLACFQCGSPKGPATLPRVVNPEVQPRLLPNQWACSRCGMVNIQGNVYCNACGRQKSDPASYQTKKIICKIKVNGAMWVCESCHYDRNHPGWNTCKKCQNMNAIGQALPR